MLWRDFICTSQLKQVNHFKPGPPLCEDTRGAHEQISQLQRLPDDVITFWLFLISFRLNVSHLCHSGYLPCIILPLQCFVFLLSSSSTTCCYTACPNLVLGRRSTQWGRGSASTAWRSWRRPTRTTLIPFRCQGRRGHWSYRPGVFWAQMSQRSFKKNTPAPPTLKYIIKCNLYHIYVEDHLNEHTQAPYLNPVNL